MPEMRVTRRGFLGEALAAFGFAAAGGRTLFAAPKGWKPPKGAKLVFGALSDTHLRTDYTGLKAARTFPHKYLISALEYFRSQNVDAVVHCGDAAHRGQIRELEFHAEAWNKVFPKGLAPDGHRIEKLFVTGNHEIDGWQYGNDVGFKVERVFTDPEERARRILATDIASSWERVWGETYEPVWHKEVKGYHFFGRHYGAEERKIARLVKAVEKKQGFRDGRKPFFVLSHIRPHAALNKAMAKFPEAISLFGHWHHSASNWNVIFDWGGAVAIQVPACLPKGWLPFAHDAYITKAKLEGGEREKIGVARQGYVFRLYDDMMAIERREFGEGGSLGTDWIMPLDAEEGDRRAAVSGRRKARRRGRQGQDTPCRRKPEVSGLCVRGGGRRRAAQGGLRGWRQHGHRARDERRGDGGRDSESGSAGGHRRDAAFIPRHARPADNH